MYEKRWGRAENQPQSQPNGMGKKRIIQKSEEELLKESKVPEQGVSRKTSEEGSGKKLKEGRVYIYSSYNNTLMTLTDPVGNVISTVSAGSIGFKGTKKSTPFAASKVAENLAQIAKAKGIDKIEIRIKGIGSGRDSALRSLGGKGLEVTSIQDITPLPHNGPRAPKVRRI